MLRNEQVGIIEIVEYLIDDKYGRRFHEFLACLHEHRGELQHVEFSVRQLRPVRQPEEHLSFFCFYRNISPGGVQCFYELIDLVSLFFETKSFYGSSYLS